MLGIRADCEVSKATGMYLPREDIVQSFISEVILTKRSSNPKCWQNFADYKRGLELRLMFGAAEMYQNE